MIIPIISCGGNNHSDVRRPVIKHKVLYIQPLGEFPAEGIASVSSSLQKTFKGSIVLRRILPLPKQAFNAKRNRYRADSLLRYLDHITPDGSLCIGLTTADISTTKDNHPDWGIFGLGYCPGKVCVASLYRLKGKDRLQKLYKVAIHELGHTQGLNHCLVKSCLMRDAQGKDCLDSETEFCVNCKAYLRNSGWSL